MNDTFLNDAFNAEQQELISTSAVTAGKNSSYNTYPGNATTDKVFLLSITEAEKYFPTDEERKCVATGYAKANGAYTSSFYTAGGAAATCWWWLRSPGSHQFYAAFVHGYGLVDCDGDAVSRDAGCVRPAIWLNIAE